LAFTKEEKKNLVESYEKWLSESRASFVLAFNGMTVKEIEQIRSDAREIGAEFHVVKNTLMDIALNNTGFENTGIFDEASIVAFAFEDAPSLAKIVDRAGSMDMFKIKGGYMDGKPITASEIQSLAQLPPMPQMRAQLLALIQTPATQLLRTISEPARGIAAVLKAYSEKSPAQAAS